MSLNVLGLISIYFGDAHYSLKYLYEELVDIANVC